MNLHDIFIQQELDKESLAEELNRFQNNYKVQLHDSYVKFILEFNNSPLRSSKFIFTRSFEDGFKQSFYLEEFFSLEKTRDFYKIFHNTQPEDELREANVTPIAKVEGRTYVCIGISPNNIGQIFLWDGDFGVTKQAQNLNDFFDSLSVDQK